MIRFILNNETVATDLPPGYLLVDFIRYTKNLKGTKIGCREGDCGACVVLAGQIRNDELHYQSLTSCLTPLANIHNKHVVTIEGINMSRMNPLQQAMTDESATQCGFCTPGFVVSFAGFCLSRKEATVQNAIASVDGNICRCTGYKSIERAAEKIADLFKNRGSQAPANFSTANHILPEYFSGIEERLRKLSSDTNGELSPGVAGDFVSGGTDLYVQKHDDLKHQRGHYLFNHPSLKEVYQEGDNCILGASITVTELAESPVMRKHFPKLDRYIKLISSTPIRNIATVAGNFINASPIGDLTIFFLALNATVTLTDNKDRRDILLRDLYKGYKVLAKRPEEYIEKIWFRLPGQHTRFHFEKVSKRTWLDIATVNSAFCVEIKDGIIQHANLSAGGVAPVPMFLKKTSEFLQGKSPGEALIGDAIGVMQEEISPISDVRGSERYKRLLLSQLVKAHFIELDLVPAFV